MAAIDSRYARAFAAVVASQKLDPQAAETQLNDFATVLADNAALREVLENPSIPEEQKLRVMDGLAGKLGLYPALRNFIAVITAHGRLSEFASIVSSYQAIADADAQVTEAEIVTAHPLDADNKALLEQQVSKLAGGTRVQATYTEDKSLLGGAVVKIGSTVYDGSVRAQLEQLKQRLVSATA